MAKTQLDIAPDEVVLAPPRTVPKTSSGKLRRSAARTAIRERLAFEKGLCALVAADEALVVRAWPSRPPSPAQDLRPCLRRLLVGGAGRRRQHGLVRRSPPAEPGLAPPGDPLRGAHLLVAYGAVAQGRGGRADPCAQRAARRQPFQLSGSCSAIGGDPGSALLCCQGGAGGSAGSRSIPAPHRHSVRAQNRRKRRR